MALNFYDVILAMTLHFNTKQTKINIIFLGCSIASTIPILFREIVQLGCKGNI